MKTHHKIQYSFMIKALSKVRIRDNIFKLLNGFVNINQQKPELNRIRRPDAL